MVRLCALLALISGLAGCVWGIERGNEEKVTLTHYGSALGEVGERAERWCSRFERRAQVRTTERVDTSGVYYRTTYSCLPA